MNYKSINDLNKDIKKWLPSLPHDIDIVVGVPRSGCLVANLIALYLNLPLTDIDGLVNNRIMSSGPRLEKNVDLKTPRKILVVDDSVCEGTQIKSIKQKLKNLKHKIYYAAPYTTVKGTRYLDFWYEIVELPRVFEWNVMHHDILSNSCVDIDGVLCRDPTESENDDGDKYINFVLNATPLVIPTKPIGWIVTSRLEKYRELTERWLKEHNISYKHLIMLDVPSKEDRVKGELNSYFKANIYKSTNTELFIESSSDQARDIVRLTGKPVLCFETGEMMYPNKALLKYNNGKRLFHKLIENPRYIIKAPKFICKIIYKTYKRFDFKLKRR